MELSPTIPKITIRAASVTVLSGISHRNMIPTDMKIVIGIMDAETRADRKGNRIISTTMTIMIAETRSLRKDKTD